MSENHFAIPIIKSGGGLADDEFRGIANAQIEDYAGDILISAGLEMRDSEVPLLIGHDTKSLVGRARLMASSNVVNLYGKFAPKGVSALADEWRGLLKNGIATDLSVGFKPIEREMRKDGGGWIYTKWRCLEVSICAVGCNPAAVVTEKSWTKAGRVLSGANATKLQQAHDAAESCRALVADVLDGAGGGDTDEAKAKRLRTLQLLSVSPEPPLSVAEQRRLRTLALLSIPPTVW